MWEEQTCIASGPNRTWLYKDANTDAVLKATVKRPGYYPIDPSGIDTGWVRR
jgi:hypothetical protein